MLNIFYRNIKWRLKNPISIIITASQPLLWLLLYSTVASQSMKDMNISNYTAFILPGIMLLVAFAASSSSGMINYIMKSSGSFYRILIAPISRKSIVLGHILEGVCVSFIEVGVLFIVSLFFSVKITSGFMGFIFMSILIFMTGFFMSSIAYSISLSLPNEVIYETVMNMIVLPVFFLSSALFPVDDLTGLLKIIINLNPFTHVINILRNLIYNKSIIFSSLVPVIILLAIICFLSFLLAIHKLKKETAH